MGLTSRYFPPFFHKEYGIPLFVVVTQQGLFIIAYLIITSRTVTSMHVRTFVAPNTTAEPQLQSSHPLSPVFSF